MKILVPITWGAQFSILRAPWTLSWYLGLWKNRTRRQRAGEFAQLLLTRPVTVFCTDHSLLRVTFRFAEKTNDEYCADQKIFSWRPRVPTEADGGNSRQIRRLGVCCFQGRLWMFFWTSPRSQLILPKRVF